MRLILASRSPRRATLLAAAGYEYEIVPADVDEGRVEGEASRQYVARVAALKAAAIARRHPARVVLGADTVVVVDETVLGKPADEEAAHAMLEQLSGRAHDVLTAVVLRRGTVELSAVEATRVEFRPLTPEQRAWYVRSGEPLGKAGGYAIQGLASRFVHRIEGSYANVVGLPVATVAALIERLAGGGGPLGPGAGSR